MSYLREVIRMRIEWSAVTSSSNQKLLVILGCCLSSESAMVMLACCVCLFVLVGLLCAMPCTCCSSRCKYD